MTQHILEGTPQELAPYLAQRPNARFRLIELSEEDEEHTEEVETNRLLPQARAGTIPTERDPDLVARVRSIRGKYARTDGVAGTEELHQDSRPVESRHRFT